jgi:S-formylglutathione hydrolase
LSQTKHAAAALAATLAASLILATPALALDGKLVETTVPSANVPGPVPVMIYTPPGYDPARKEPYPLIIQLHGGGGSDQNMKEMAVLLDQAIEKGIIPPVVSVMPSAGRSFYMDYKDGSEKWETFVVSDLLSYMRANTDVVKTRQGTFITGISMGGMGSMRIALKHPDVFQAVASQEPGIEPVLKYDDIQLRDRFYRPDALFKRIYGDPIDKDYWAANNPASIVAKDPERILGMGIYLEVGDQDMFYLNQGTEFLHRVLFDNGVSHEYRLVKGGDHVGASIAPRFLDALGFFNRMINPPVWIDERAMAARQRLDLMKKNAGYPLTDVDPNRIHAK